MAQNTMAQKIKRRPLRQAGKNTGAIARSAPAVITALAPADMPSAPAERATPEALTILLQHGFSEQEISTLVIPRRTLARRRAGGEPLTIEETDKAMRLERIAALAERVFGDPVKAHRWLRKAKHGLQGEAPLAFLASETGARVVEEMLHRIEHGMIA